MSSKQQQRAFISFLFHPRSAGVGGEEANSFRTRSCTCFLPFSCVFQLRDISNPPEVFYSPSFFPLSNLESFFFSSSYSFRLLLSVGPHRRHVILVITRSGRKTRSWFSQVRREGWPFAWDRSSGRSGTEMGRGFRKCIFGKALVTYHQNLPSVYATYIPLHLTAWPCPNNRRTEKRKSNNYH